MTATLANDQFAIKLNRIPSYIDASEEQKAAVAPAAPRSLARRIADSLTWFAHFRARQALMAEMSAMSDRELADIGLSRTDIPRVFSSNFAQDNSLARRAA